MFLIAFSIFIWFCYSFNHFNKASQVIVKNHYEPNLNQGQRQGENGQNLNPLYPSFIDVIRNPYAPPRYFFPINVSTNVGALDTTFRQVGILHPVKGPNKDNVLALMGRPVFTNRDMWQYYTIGNQLNHVKLPILTNRKNGLNEYGVNRLYSRDVVYVEGLNDAYRVTIYENDTLRYLPAI
jgi:hypothetical protein